VALGGASTRDRSTVIMPGPFRTTPGLQFTLNQDTFTIIELALFHTLGKLPEPTGTHTFF
jgi:hypothetical protein